MNTEIEIHDSRVSKIAIQGNTVVVHFQWAYLHKSNGRPGVDAGTGWVQEARLTLAEAVVRGDYPTWPCDLMDGELIAGDERYPNHIPVPFETSVSTELHLVCDSIHTITIAGTGAKLELIGVPRYVEEFTPDRPSA